MKEKILSLDVNSDLINKLDDIGNLLDGHIRKEERILFEKAQVILNEEELNDDSKRNLMRADQKNLDKKN